MKAQVQTGAGLHVVNALAPVDIDGGANSDVWSMGKYSHATILIPLGVTGGATTVTVQGCDDFTPSNTTAIAFEYYAEETAAGDTVGSRTAATTSGFAASTNDGVFYVLEIDAAELLTTTYGNMRVALSDPSGATFGAVIALLTGARYGGPDSPTAIV